MARLIQPVQLNAFQDLLRASGRRPDDFQVDEEILDPATAEVEAELGEVLVTCKKTHRVERYHVGRGADWVAEFADDLKAGKFDAAS